MRWTASEAARSAEINYLLSQLTKHRLLTNALAHDSPLVPDARERPPTEHEMGERHTGQSDGELRRYYKADQVERRRRARRADFIIKPPRRLAQRAGT